MADHCFISYSTADALDFARRLANKLEGGTSSIPVWFDKDDLIAGREWDIQIDEALKSCRMLLFVMTKDSTHDRSVCRQEWSRALSFKKPIIPLWVHKDIDVPFRLADRQRIDFRGEFDRGLAQLRDYLAWLDSPDGVLQSYKDRLLDAERDLQRANELDKPRIQADIDELKKQIEIQQKVVDNPQAAKEQTEINIKTGLERERQPEKPVAKKTSTKFINPPPGIAPNYFQDRFVETQEIAKFLHDDAQCLMTIVGRGGVGKTAMVCRLLKALESGGLPDNLGEMKIDGIVYLSETGSHRVNFPNIFADLSKLLPTETANKLDALYKNPKAPVESKMNALLEHFQGERVLLLLDNFEPLVDASCETCDLLDAELDEALRAFLNGTHTAVNILITTRVAPRALNLIQPGRQRVMTLDEGLESPYAENILREMDEDGKLGLKAREDIDPLLQRAREKTRGYPRALEALFAILSSDRYTTLEELLELPLLPENVVEALVGEAFSRLDATAQKVMQALAVYNRPVTPAAIDYLLQPQLPEIDSAPVLNRLVNMHFVRRETGRYYLHPVDHDYAFSLIPEEHLTAKTAKAAKENQKESLRASRSLRFDSFTQHNLLTRAADYFAQARKPRAEWKKLEDLFAQLAEFDLRCTAGDYDTAANVLTDFDFDYLLLWGHYRFTFSLYEKIYDVIHNEFIRQSIIGNMGSTCYYQSQYEDALHYHGIALKLAEKEGSKANQSVWVNWMGNSFSCLGKGQEATIKYELSLKLAKEAGNRLGEGIALGNLGDRHAVLGETHKAIERYEQALVFDREVGYRRGEGYRLASLGNCYAELGEVNKSIKYYEQELVIAHEIGDRRGEGKTLSNLGSRYAELGKINKAIEFYEQALVIDREIGDRSGESSILGNIASVLLDTEDYDNARENCKLAIQIAEEISSPNLQLDGQSNLSEVYLFQNDLVNARTTIEVALQYDVPQNNHNISVLHGIIALRQGDEVAARGAFVRAIRQADEILTKTPEYYDALDAKGLALCGLALCADDGPSTVDRGKLIDEAVETFKKARKIAPHAGIVKSVLRLFDELAKCDPEGLLASVREAVEEK